jgi:hypothetical protein
VVTITWKVKKTTGRRITGYFYGEIFMLWDLESRGELDTRIQEKLHPLIWVNLVEMLFPERDGQLTLGYSRYK